MLSLPLTAGALAGLSDTDFTSLANLDLVCWVAGSSKFENKSAADAGLSAVGHTHTSTDITDLTEAVQDIVGAFFADTSTIDITYNDAANSLVADILAANTLAALSVMVGDSGSGGVKGLVPAPASGDATKFLRGDGTFADAPGTGTVTSVDITLPSWLAVSGNPITTSGTLAVAMEDQTQGLFLASPVSSTGAPVFRAIDPADLPSGIGGGSTGWEANLLVNSSFQNWTHGATSTTAPTPTAFTTVGDGVYGGPGRWKFFRDSVAVKIKQIAGRAGFSSKGVEVKNESGAGGAYFSLEQILESGDTLCLRGADVVASVQIQPQSETKTYSLLIMEWTGTADAISPADLINDWDDATIAEGNFIISSGSLAILASGTLSCSTGSWQQLTVTGTVGASANNLIVMLAQHGSGNDMSNNASVQITEFGCYRGTTAPDYVETPFAQTERDCQRWHWYLGMGGSGDFYKSGMKVKTNRIRGFYSNFPVRMRSIPTATNNISTTWATAAPTGNQVAAFDEGASTYLTISGALTIGIAAYDPYQFVYYFQAATSFSGTVGVYCELTLGEDVVIHFDCSL